MKARTLTLFYDPAIHSHNQTIHKLSAFSSAVQEALTNLGVELQSVRLATSPLLGWAGTTSEKELIILAQNLEALAAEHNFAYLSLGPIVARDVSHYNLIPSILAATRNVFMTAMMTAPQGSVDLAGVHACAEIITRTAHATPDGFTNLRFSALANVPPGTPFLPAAYHYPGQPPAFAIGMETADTIFETFNSASSLASARDTLLSRLENQAERIQAALFPLTIRYGVSFLGFDFSTAPFPSDTCSAGRSLEALGVKLLGEHGSLAAAAFLADTLDRGSWLRTGFNGLMLPILEDSYLARRSSMGMLTVKDLLLFSAVCGTGLDTVPLPGGSTPAQLAGLLLDVAALAQRLRKPLTARLMPIPGKASGEAIHYDFEFFADGNVMEIPASGLTGLLAGSESFDLQPRANLVNAPL